MYTTVALPQSLPKGLRAADIRTSALQHLPAMDRRFRHYFMLYPFAVEHFDLSSYDLIFSSSSGYAKGVRRRRNAIHVCYCHTPMRWVWRYEDYVARERFSGGVRTLLPLLLWGLRKWDLRASQQPNYYIANSQLVAQRIKKIYGRESHVIPPPIDVNQAWYDWYVAASPTDRGQVFLFRTLRDPDARHAHAQNIRISLHGTDGLLSLAVQDDGVGFGPRDSRGKGLGLIGMEERVGELGGQIEILSHRLHAEIGVGIKRWLIRSCLITTSAPWTWWT